MPIDPCRELEATASDFGTVRWHTDFFVTGFDAGTYFVFKGLNFARGLSEITLAVAASKGGGGIEIRDGSPHGAIVATLTTTATGGERDFQEQTVMVASLTGRHDLYFVSRSPAAGNVDFVRFVSRGGARMRLSPSMPGG